MKCQFTKSRDFTSFLVTSGNKGCFSTIFQSHLHGQTGQFTVWANGKQNSRRCIPKFSTTIFLEGFFPFNFAPGIFQNFRLNGSLFGKSPVSGIFGNFSSKFSKVLVELEASNISESITFYRKTSSGMNRSVCFTL